MLVLPLASGLVCLFHVQKIRGHNHNRSPTVSSYPPDTPGLASEKGGFARVVLGKRIMRRLDGRGRA